MHYLDAKAARVRASRMALPDAEAAVEDLLERGRSLAVPPSLAEAVRTGETVTVIAEFKRRSPSAGDLAADEDVVQAVELYHQGGARAVSVLTDTDDFGGNLADLRAAAEHLPLPVLRKDFIVDELGVYEARCRGAAAVLLIVRMLEAHEVSQLLRAAADVGLDALVETHDERELEVALDAGARIVGLNNRDLQRLETDLAVTERLAARVPGGVAVVSESGIRSVQDVRRARDAGAHAVLIGEALLRVPTRVRRALVEEMAGVPR